MLLLINNLHKKASQKVKTDEILTEHAICNLHTYNFALLLHEKCTGFQPIRSTIFSCTMLTP